MSISDTFLKSLLKLTALGLLFMLLASWTFGSVAVVESVKLIETFNEKVENSEHNNKVYKIKEALGMQTLDYDVVVSRGSVSFKGKVPYNFRLHGVMEDTKWLLNQRLSGANDKKNLVYKQPNG